MENEKLLSKGYKDGGISVSRETIKYIAVFTMFLNHFAHIFLEPGSLAFVLMVDSGYFTAITMCYFLAEGYRYTHSKSKYALRLLIFAAISEIPFILAFGYLQFNMLFTLLFSFCFIWLNDISKDYIPSFVKIILKIILLVLCYESDWTILALFYVWYFARHYGDRQKMKRVFFVNILLFFLYQYTTMIGIYSPIKTAALSFLAIFSQIVSAIIILFFYNGKKSKNVSAFSKWFFYIFYPLHLIIFVIIRLCIES